MPAHSKAHYRGTYQKRAAQVRAGAYADTTTRCWRCGLTLDEARQRTGKPIKWQAGHVVDGAINGLLRAEHSHCNASAGATYGNARREPRSRQWSL